MDPGRPSLEGEISQALVSVDDREETFRFRLRHLADFVLS